MNNIKQTILDEINKASTVFYKVSSIQYRTRCPFCGDSQKNPRECHLYLKCDLDDQSEPILYNCFKCPAGGRVTQKFLDRLNINVEGMAILDSQYHNRIPSIKKLDVELLTGTPLMISAQAGYVHRRLGRGLKHEDYDRFKIVWNMAMLADCIKDNKVVNTLPNNQQSISFLSDDKSVLLTRSFTDDHPRWVKRTLFNSGNRAFYTIKQTFDLFTTEDFTVNITEGTFDIISVYKNFNTGENSLYLATLGSDYKSAVDYTINLGLMGSNVNLRIYLDTNIDEKILKEEMKNYKWIFGKISLYKNIKFEDWGTTIDNIKAVEYRV